MKYSKLTASELRLGNLIYNTKGEVDTVNIEALTYILNEEGLHQAMPVTITEEWLLRMRFELQGGEVYFHKDIRVVYTEKEPEPLSGRFNGVDFWLSVFNGWKAVNQVHELQNLVFVLTGKELTINQ